MQNQRPSLSPTVVAWAALLLASIVVILAYLPGLHGPFLLDDVGNLEPLHRWTEGRLGWRGVVLDNRSGPTGRPLSMLTFLFDAWRMPALASIAFKPTNLAIHIVTACLAFTLTWRAALATRHFDQRQALGLGVIIAVVWMWLPIQVSTVLYVVQRMAQLAALFTLATLTAYLHARACINKGQRVRGGLVLWLLVPALGACAALSKENGALAFPLLAVAEITLFRGPRTRQVWAFLAITVGFPCLLVGTYLALHPWYFSAGYAGRPFTLDERLLTEPRVLWSYLQTAFFPVGPRMGIFHDNFPLSTSLWQPITTLLAIGAWVGVIVLAWLLRRRAPLFTFGVCAFLVAHTMESGPLSLELYFEHRNYLPLVFALIALAGLVFALPRPRARVQWAAAGCGALLMLVYLASTWNHATGWGDDNTFYSMQYRYNPTSPRLLSNLAGRSMEAGDLKSALYFIGQTETYSPKTEAATSTLWRFGAYCAAKTPIPDELYGELALRATGRVTSYAMVAVELLADQARDGCTGLDANRAANTVISWIDRSPQTPGEQELWRSRYNAARLLAASGHISEARDETQRAWIDSAHNNGVGVFLFQLNATLGDRERCGEVLAYLERAAHGDNKDLVETAKAFRQALDSGQIGNGKP
ncbi:MAG: hypothetical protein WBW32_04695 [Luteibacter sp.]